MINVNVDGHNIGVYDERLDGAITLRLIQKSRSDGSYSLDLLDRLIEGGADRIFEILDPVNGDPSIEHQVVPFITRLFEQIGNDNQVGADSKNSLGSQTSYPSVSQQSEPTSNDTSGSTSPTPITTKYP